MTNPASGDATVGTADITPRVLRTPRAAGLAGEWLTSASSRRDIRFALGLVPFCGIFFLWFMGAIRARIGESEDKFLSTVFLGSGLLFIAMVFVFAALFGALIGVAGLHNGSPPLDIWQLGRETRSILPPSTPCGWGQSS